MIKDKYIEKLDKVLLNKQVVLKEVNKLSTLRIVMFLCITVFFLLMIVSYWFSIIGVISLGCFIYFIIKYKKENYKLREYLFLEEVYNEYLKRLDGTWISFSDSGKDLNYESFLKELDVIGDYSLFKYISVCKTPQARKDLINKLLNKEIEKTKQIESIEIIKAIKEEEFAFGFEAKVKEFVYETQDTNISSNLNLFENKFKLKLLYCILGGIFSSMFIGGVVLFSFGIIDIYLLLLIYLICLAYSIFLGSKYKDALAIIFKINTIYGSISILTSYLKNISSKNSKLNSIFKNCNENNNSLKRTFKYIELFKSLYKNLLSYLVFGPIFFIVLIIVWFYSKNEKKFNCLKKIVHDVEWLQVMTSLAIISNTKEKTNSPSYNNSSGINVKNIYHPLLIETKAISNDFNSKNEINMLTGSNMAGKTLFLKTIGLNLVLCYAGAYVCAEEFSCCYYKLYTSIGIVDNISSGISTFLAEVLRIKEIVNSNNKSVLVLIDELFKGTNAQDRIIGGLKVIESLKKLSFLSIITTHDKEFCMVENVNNYHFTEDLDKEDIVFDYKLKNGILEQTNALKILKREGIYEK